MKNATIKSTEALSAQVQKQSPLLKIFAEVIPLEATRASSKKKNSWLKQAFHKDKPFILDSFRKEVFFCQNIVLCEGQKRTPEIFKRDV